MKEQFELYARRDCNNQGFSTTELELRKFVGILIISGYHTLPRLDDYWSTAEDLGCAIVAKTMSRNRFKELKRYCHLADNQNLGPSRVAKVQPIYESLNKALTQFGISTPKISLDESMVPYYCHHGA